ncbi:MAG: Na/Pi cotransporter family protein [Spirochaetaceae bacterium]|jgi:phosphate:Na+ symporter|nr:Na/Pi cotransporter family protein [Spirochaetaceae bacterium]
MQIGALIFRLLGGLCIFLYGMRVLSDGIQKAAGDRLQRALNFMTGNRFTAVFTGFIVTTLVQSSSATTVMLVSFANAGLLTLTQATGVIMGANVGTTTTAWIISLLGFQFDIAALALPALSIGFFMRLPKWKYRDWGEALLGFGLLFIGLDFVNGALPRVEPQSMEFIRRISGMGFLAVLIGLGTGAALTLLMHSSAATITLIIALAFRGIITFEISAAMILGANIGTTIDAIMAALGAKTAAKQAALVHVLFNVIGSAAALVFLKPLILLVDFLTPGPLTGSGIVIHLAMFHTVFNLGCTLIFLPFVNQFAALVSILIKDRPERGGRPHYRLEVSSGLILASPEFSIVRAEKEIRDMAGFISAMYAEICRALTDLFAADADTAPPGEEAVKARREQQVDSLVASMKAKEDYADEMREELSRFLIECTRRQLSPRSAYNIAELLRIIADLEDMADDCCGISLILERSVKKHRLFKSTEMEALAPYVKQVEDFLAFVREHLGHPLSREQIEFAELIEAKIDKARNRLRKLGRKRIEAGANIKMELLFMDLVRRIEMLGDLCYDISAALFHMN